MIIPCKIVDCKTMPLEKFEDFQNKELKRITKERWDKLKKLVEEARRKERELGIRIESVGTLNLRSGEYHSCTLNHDQNETS